MSFWNWAPTVISTFISASANQSAAKTAAAAQNRATQAQLQSIEQARQTMAQQQAMASPGLVQMQNVIRNQGTLTPAQLAALDDARRTTLGQLGASGLRGSARATAATVRDVEGRMRDQYMDANQRRADSAAGTLSGQYFNAGNNVANLQTAGGTAVSQGLANVGNIQSNQTLAQGDIAGKAIGDIGSVIADSIKNSNRGTSYTDYRDGTKIKWDV